MDHAAKAKDPRAQSLPVDVLAEVTAPPVTANITRVKRWLAGRAHLGERGASAVEFAVIAPLFILLVCGLIDCGLIFGGYLSMENGVGSAARQAAVGDYTYTGKCSGGPSSSTAEMVCNVAQSIGPLSGSSSGSLKIGICFVSPGGTPSCSGQTSTGTSVSQDVEVCAQEGLESTTGLTAPMFDGQIASTSSRMLIEEPQPSASTSFSSFNSSSTVVAYGSTSIAGMNCS